MNMKKRYLWAVLVGLVVLTFTACTSYKNQEVPFRAPAAYGNMQIVAGAQVAGEAFADKDAAKKAFGFDIRDAGLLPVMVVVDNLGSSSLKFVPDQTFLVDDNGGMWNILPSRTAYERLEKSSEYSRIAKEGGRGSILGGAGGALVGAAIGILSGENVGNSALKGAAVGAAGGAVIGGASEAGSDEGYKTIARDIANKELKNYPIEPGVLARGFIFFPGEAPSAKQLRLQLEEVSTGEIHTIYLNL